MVGVSDGDSFTYVLEEYEDSLGPYSIAYNHSLPYNRTSNAGLEIVTGGEFTITVINATPSSKNPIEIGVQYSNGSHTVDHTAIFIFQPPSFSALFGGNRFIMFTDWAFYEVSVPGELQNYKDAEYINSFEFINGEKGFFWSIKGSEEDPEAFIETAHDKITGMLLYKSWNFTRSGGLTSGTLRQNEYENLSFSFPDFLSTIFILALFAIITVLFATIIFLRRKKYL